MSSITLKKFASHELILSPEETKTVLKFFFKPVDHELIDNLPADDLLRGFAQGLLVEAIDASYAVGFVEALFRSCANPTKGALSIIKGFGKNAAKHWFKHATAKDLTDVQIYEFVKDTLARSFRSKLISLQESNSSFPQRTIFISYVKPHHTQLLVWG